MKEPRARSLKWRLVWRLTALHAVAMMAPVVVIMTILVQMNVFSDPIMDAEATTTIGEAVSRQPDGSLAVRDTPEMQSLRKVAPDLWFLVTDEAGNKVSERAVPAVLESLAGHLDQLDFAEVRGGNREDGIFAHMAVVESEDAGKLRVFTGQGEIRTAGFLIFLLSQIVVLPLLAIIALITFIAIPIIVRRAMSGLQDAAALARGIDIDEPGTRLPVNGVPSEIVPLVNAVNGALGRLDEGYERHKRFLLDAAHELRTPIAILQTRLEALPSSAEQARLLADARRLWVLAEQLLDLQRLNQPRTKLQPVDLVSLARNVAADTAPLAIAAGYELSFQTDCEQVEIIGDQASLERALTNLVQNALDHGGGVVTVSVGSDGAIEVADEGRGIPPEERERIFEPFYRAHPIDRGTGLGLHLVQEVVKLHGGHVTAHDGPTGGARFRMTFPIGGLPKLREEPVAPDLTVYQKFRRGLQSSVAGHH